jgi:D-alanyl-D-alanine carboxypeptidase
MAGWMRGLFGLLLFIPGIVLLSACSDSNAPAVDVAGVTGDAPAATATPSGPEATVEKKPTLAPVVWTATPEPSPTPQPAPWGSPPIALTTIQPSVSAAAALVMDEASGAVLYEKDAHTRRGPASLTKIATAILAIESGDLDRWVDIDISASSLPGSTVMGLQEGDRFTLRDLLYGLMLPSGNDAALAIGRDVAGSDAAFVDAMNGLAERLGLANTHFVNPHGLGRGGHYGSAYDLAVLSRYAMTLPDFAALASARSWTAEGNRTIRMSNLNPMLGDYHGADGIKTGFTRGSGKTLVVSAVQDGHRVYVVLLNAPDREGDAVKLLDWAFAAHRWP